MGAGRFVTTVPPLRHTAIYLRGRLVAVTRAWGYRRSRRALLLRPAPRRGAGVGGGPSGGSPGGAAGGLPRGGANAQGLPLAKPAYDRIAHDMTTARCCSRRPTSTPDEISNHPALRTNCSRLASRAAPPAGHHEAGAGAGVPGRSRQHRPALRPRRRCRDRPAWFTTDLRATRSSSSGWRSAAWRASRTPCAVDAELRWASTREPCARYFNSSGSTS